MPVAEKYKAQFRYDTHYHIIFKSIDDLLLFREPGNYEFFLQRFTFFLNPVLNGLAYCLLNNHAHFVIKVKSREVLLNNIILLPGDQRTLAMKNLLTDPRNDQLIDVLVERLVNSFMVSYVNSYNSAFGRKGSLFQSPFRRVVIADEVHLHQSIIYVHANAQKHNLVEDFKKYPWSSYHDVISGSSQYIAVNEVLQFFGSKDSFIETHAGQVEYFYE